MLKSSPGIRHVCRLLRLEPARKRNSRKISISKPGIEWHIDGNINASSVRRMEVPLKEQHYAWFENIWRSQE